ncbi:MAG: hypothetical protein KatS3mg082_3319 [Nitrospiraceae bacterium]|nr:MAG: hypothetical protein KatS3mg082_3319 [Nitrospiraceae bacterium]
MSVPLAGLFLLGANARTFASAELTMKINYQYGGHQFEVEVPILPVFVAAAQRLSLWWRRDPLRPMVEPLGLVTSNLFALAAGTVIQTPSGTLTAAPLLKALPDGQVKAVSSGFPVTGVHDVYGQLTVASALGARRRSFVVVNDLSPDDARDRNLICFGSPTSNLLSEEIFDGLHSVLAPSFSWGEGYASFTLDGSTFTGGNAGVVLAYRSPWSGNRRVLVLSGIGPSGTLACCKLVSHWATLVVSKKQRKVRDFVAAVEIEEADKAPTLKRLVALE